MNDYSDIFYAMGAMILFSMLVINTNSSIVRNDIFMVENELEHTAIALAQSVIDEARIKNFDQNNPGQSEFTELPFPYLGPTFDESEVPGAFTDPGVLGPDPGEVWPNFNDFDDYNGLEREVSTDHGRYTISTEVYYVSMNNTDVNAGQRTEHKRMDVFVTSTYFDHTVTLSYIKSF